MKRWQVVNDHYLIQAINKALVAKGILQEGEMEAASNELNRLEAVKMEQFAADWWKQIKLGDRASYYGRQGIVISTSIEPWRSLSIKIKAPWPFREKLVLLQELDRSLEIKFQAQQIWSRCAGRVL